ncbi:signal transduction histidine kinase [Psychrobacter sp. PL19]|uniref:sensor histidine kinase n=1 Tax=Psychrobacter sp. PL19 TaxID=2760711 RepID=UPI001AEAD7AC
MTELTYNIRPSARLIKTIGEDLIGDSNAALMELIKNSYDADASFVKIIFKYRIENDEEVLSIKVIDNGHGMDSNTVINKWLVPATDDKLIRKTSRKFERALQGRKGIGRFASAILGQELTLISRVEKEQTTIILDWNEFSSDKFLSDIELLVEVEAGRYETGTTIEIIAKNQSLDEDDKKSYWNADSLEKLINELRKLVTPFDEFEEDDFKISLEVINAPYDFKSGEIDVERYPIIDFYDYRIHGTVDSDGKASLTYENAVDINARQIHSFTKNIAPTEDERHCGKIELDLRVFDREADAFSNLIDKGLIDPISQEKIGKQQARRELNSVYGVNIYKNKFRISPYGNQGVDWLKLDNRRIQNPSMRIGNNQIVGFVTIQPEELSGLNEKSARDGLKENASFKGLKHILEDVIRELELKRFSFRKKSRKGRSREDTIDFQINDLFDFGDLKDVIRKNFDEQVDEQTYQKIIGLITKKEESKSKLLEDIKRQIAVYQGQATLGKIVNVVIHEGRKPLQYFQLESKNLIDSFEMYEKGNDEDILNDIKDIIFGFKKNAQDLSSLYKRITPLASQRRSKKKSFLINKAIQNSFKIFDVQLKTSKIEFQIDIDHNILAYGWEQDLEVAFTNLIENSIFWLSKKDTDDKLIQVKANMSLSNECSIFYKDNGPGIKEDYIVSGDVFDPGFTTKDTDDATGLGLAIAGEAVERLEGKLYALESDEGACFEIKIKVPNDVK